MTSTVGLFRGKPSVIDLDAPELKGIEFHPSVKALEWTPQMVLDLAFPEPGRTTEEGPGTAAWSEDAWVAQAQRNYLNRMAVRDRMNQPVRRLEDMLYDVYNIS